MNNFEKVRSFIKCRGAVKTHELEAFAKYQQPIFLGGSAHRYARKLLKDGLVEHPIVDGKRDRHCYKWKHNEPSQGKLFGEG